MLIKELGINNNTSSNTTYKPISFDKDEIRSNHRSFMTSLSIPSGKESEDLPYLYWIPKLHKTPCKERYIAGSSTCSTKELSIHLTKILSAVKEGQQKYCETVYSRSGINHMWIFKNSKDLLDNLQSRSFSQVSSIKTFDFSTLYTTLPHDKSETHLRGRPRVWEKTLFSVSSQIYDHLCVCKFLLNSKLLGDKDCLHWIWPVKKMTSFPFTFP